MAELEGIGVLVTRPAAQAAPLCRLIEAQGGQAIAFPTLAILPPRDPGALTPLLASLADFQLAIFTSANAVDFLLERLPGPLPLPRAAVGRATAAALTRRGLPPQLVPETDFSSEGLLALPALQRVAGQRLLLVKGEGGRDRLAGELTRRGAQVIEANVYRRERPAADPAPLLTQIDNGEVDIVTVTSNQALANLFEMLGGAGRQWLRCTPLVAISERARRLAGELGLEGPVLLARQAGDAALVDALLEWRRNLPTGPIPIRPGDHP
ncbi:MAG: uroporphyrinogen-III synthase [Candidatus Competibacteraceae bacterium]|nr:uroporphyrinogen-III synthase [Candidatus Competibacteraceae bacterium]